jgi:hypothetical protein
VSARRRHVHLARERRVASAAICGSTAAAVSPAGARLYDRPPPFTSRRVFVSCPRCVAIADVALARGEAWAAEVEVEPPGEHTTDAARSR